MTILSVEPARSLREVAEVRLGFVSGGLLLATAALVALDAPTTVTITALFLQTGFSCLALERRTAALLLGVTGWALCTGFAVNQLGELTFAPPDLVRLGAYAAWALTCQWLGAPQ